MRKILYTLAFCLLSFNAKAVDENVFATGTLNFGKFVQIGTSSVVIMSTSSQRTLSSGAIDALSPDKHSATLNTYTKPTYNNGTIPSEIQFNQTKQADLGYCSASITNLQFSTTTINTAQNTNVSVGATLNINGYCKEGIYRGDIDIAYQLTIDGVATDKIVRVPFEFEIEEPLSVSKAAEGGDMDFGMWITPSEDSTITISSGGLSTTGNIVRVGAKTPHCANIIASGVMNRRVQMTFDAASMYLYLSGDTNSSSKLLVDHFTVDSNDVAGADGTVYSFYLPATGNAQATKNLAVGATLTVPAGTASGTYTGSINVTFIYNDY